MTVGIFGGSFPRLVAKNEDKPDRIKSPLPRFVDYLVWHADEKGEGLGTAEQDGLP